MTCHLAMAAAGKAGQATDARAPAVAKSAAGGSAQRSHDQRVASRETRVNDRFPCVGALLLKVVPEPQTTRAWATGAEGEREVGRLLDDLSQSGVISLHDRRKPGSQTNIDHVAIGPAGIYVIDAKKYKGRVERRDVGGWARTDRRLYVGGRNRTPLVMSVIGQASAIRSVLGHEFARVPITPVLCSVTAEIGVFASPFLLQGVQITWRRPLRRQLSRPGPMDSAAIAHLAEVLDDRLAPA